MVDRLVPDGLWGLATLDYSSATKSQAACSWWCGRGPCVHLRGSGYGGEPLPIVNPQGWILACVDQTRLGSALLLVPEADILSGGDVLPCAHDQVHGEYVVVDRLPGHLREEYEIALVRCHVPRVGEPADLHADAGAMSAECSGEDGLLEAVQRFLVLLRQGWGAPRTTLAGTRSR